MKPGLPPDEEKRLEALHAYAILDTDREKEFDDLTLLASQICGAPIAMISLVDENRQWFKSKIGLTTSETSRDIALCAHGILQAEVFVIPDAQKDERFADNPLVTGNPRIRFYAGAPLKSPDGHALGMICVNDQVPRELSPEQLAALQALSRQVVAQLELRRASNELRTTVAQLEKAQHDLRLRTAFFEAQVNSSSNGILVVDSQGRKILQNRRMNELLKIPQDIVDIDEDRQQLEWVTSTTKNPGLFLEKVDYLYAHPNEVSRDEVEFKDGTVLDRYSSPVVGQDGTYYGRIWSFHDVTERKRAEETLRASEEKFRQLADNISDVFWMTSPDLQKIHYISRAYAATWGRSTESLYANPHQWIEAVVPAERERVWAAFSGLTHDESSVSIEYQIARPDGTVRWIHDRGFQVRDAAGDVIRLAGIAADITEKKQIEARLSQAQKMETVGKLAGGVAHEFNSILTAIIGQSEALVEGLPVEGALGNSAREIRLAADRAATLTRQLLAYGRKQILQPEILDLNRVLAEIIVTLQHLMGRDVDVRFVPKLGLKKVKIDPGQMDQVILSIAMNAADAMPNGGKFTLETANVTLDEDYVRLHPGLKPGGYVMISMSDTGIGMGAEVKARAFEPFFSTKSVGEGIGLGLATCYGIIKQSEGHISLYSEVARGSTVRIYLPEFEQLAKSSRLPKPANLPQGTETILLAEDDPALLEMAATLLRRLGYTVLTAVNGVEALNLKNQRDVGHIDLLLTDVVMPHMSGKELSDRIRAIYPRTRILFTSAYAENAIVHQGILNEGVILLQKPFTPSALASKVREVLDQPLP